MHTNKIKAFICLPPRGPTPQASTALMVLGFTGFPSFTSNHTLWLTPVARPKMTIVLCVPSRLGVEMGNAKIKPLAWTIWIGSRSGSRLWLVRTKIVEGQTDCHTSCHWQPSWILARVYQTSGSTRKHAEADWSRKYGSYLRRFELRCLFRNRLSPHYLEDIGETMSNEVQIMRQSQNITLFFCFAWIHVDITKAKKTQWSRLRGRALSRFWKKKTWMV